MAAGFIKDVGLSLTGASLAGFTMYQLKLPLLLGYIVAGVLLGPHLGFGVIHQQETVSMLSEIGLVFLMFILGMEIDIQKLLKAGKAVFVNGITQFVGCVLLGLGFFSLWGYQFATGDFSLIYLAIAASLSSTLIVVKILSERVELDTLSSRITLGILVLQDVWAIGFLATQPNLAHFNLTILLLSLVKAGVLVGISALLAKFVLPWLFEKIAKHSELTLIMAMGWCFSIAQLASLLGLSMEMGALVAGVSMASFPYHVQIAVKVSSLRDFFVTLFFVALGLQIPMPTKEIFSLALGVVAFTLLSRVFTIYPVLYFMRYGNRGSLIPGINLSQVSEFSLVILSLGVSYQHISADILSAFILALVCTALLSSWVIPHSHQLYRLLNPLLEKIGMRDRVDQLSKEVSPAARHEARIVFLGFYREASSIIGELEHRHSPAALADIQVVDINPETIKKLEKKGIQVHYGDVGHSDTLEHLELQHASLIISTIPDSVLRGTSNAKLLRAMQKIAPQARIIVTAETLVSAKELYAAGAAYVCLPRLVSAHYLADILERIESGQEEIVRENALQNLHTRGEILD